MNNHDHQFLALAAPLARTTSGSTAAAADTRTTGALVISAGAGADICVFERPIGARDGSTHLNVSDITAGGGSDVIDLNER